MQIKKQTIINISILVILAFLLGIIAGKIIDWPFFKLDNNVSISEIFSLVVTFIIAYVISKVIEKEKQDNREGKNLIIKRLEDILHLIDDTSIRIDTNILHYPEAASIMKRIYGNFESIFIAINKSSITLNSISSQEVLQKIIKLKKLLTDSPRVDSNSIQVSNLSIQVKDNILHFSKNRVIEIDKEFETLKRLIFELQMAVNLF